jgi:hypothetical protein
MCDVQTGLNNQLAARCAARRGAREVLVAAAEQDCHDVIEHVQRARATGRCRITPEAAVLTW